MTLYLILHSIFDLVIVVVGVFIWRRVKLQGEAEKSAPASTAASLNETSPDYRKEFEMMQVAFQERLTVLNTICEGARRILSEGGVVGPGVSTASRQVSTREATELQEVIKASTKQIPTLEHIEATKERMKRDLPIDLRSILKDQLV